MTKSEKVKVLQEIAAGKATINDLLPETVECFYQIAEGEDHYSHHRSNKILTNQDINEYAKSHPKSKCLIFCRQPGNEPLNATA